MKTPAAESNSMFPTECKIGLLPVKGTFGMFRNPMAHEARVKWVMTKDDAEDLLSLVSLTHRRLDASRMCKRDWSLDVFAGW